MIKKKEEKKTSGIDVPWPDKASEFATTGKIIIIIMILF